MKVSKLKSLTPKVLKPKNITDVGQFIQTQLESAEINERGSVKIIPPAKIKFKPVTGSCVLPKIERQTVKYIQKEDEVPSLIEMKFEKLGEKTVDQFKKMEEKVTSNDLDLDEIEDVMWSSLITRCTQRKGPNPVYATEWTESRIDDKDEWNINGFTEKHSILNMNTKTDRIPGVQSSYVIVGMQGTWFCAHIEDNDLASMNILLEGHVKIWYIIPQKYAKKFEKLFKHLLGKLSQQLCDTVLRHKCFIIPPWVLAKNGIEYTKHIQRPGEVMLTMYGAYHFGFNTGFNVCEASNLASPKFFDFYQNARLCKPDCWLYNRTNATKIKLASLLKKYKESTKTGSTSTQKHRHSGNAKVLQSVQSKSKKKYTENGSTSTQKQRHTGKVKIRQSVPPKPEKETSKDDPLYLLSVRKTDDLKSTYRQQSKKARHQCSQCHSSFGRPSNLAKHQRMYHDSVVIRYECSVCHFMSPKQHLVINHQQKEHECTENMRVKEVEVKNSKRKQQEWLMNLLKPAKRICIREDKTCDVCSNVLRGTHSLKRHMKNVHKIDEDEI